MPWLPFLFTLIPEVVRGIVGICRDKYAAQKAEEDRKKAEIEAEQEKLKVQNKK